MGTSFSRREPHAPPTRGCTSGVVVMAGGKDKAAVVTFGIKSAGKQVRNKKKKKKKKGVLLRVRTLCSSSPEISQQMHWLTPRGIKEK